MGDHDHVNGYDVAGQEIITPAEPQDPPQDDQGQQEGDDK